MIEKRRGGIKSLTVEGFGPIKRAHVEMAPFVMLVGQNGTGKTYLAHLLWAYHNSSFAISDSEITGNSDDAYLLQAIKRAVEGVRQINTKKFNEVLVRAIEKNLRGELGRKMNRLFAHQVDVPRGIDFKIELKNKLKSIELYSGSIDDIIDSAPLFRHVYFMDGHLTAFAGDGSVKVKSIKDGTEIDQYNLDAIKKFVFGDESVQYIPAARTGLVLALDALIPNQLMKLASGDEGKQPTVSRPVAAFLSSLTHKFYPKESAYARNIYATHIEEKVLGGKVERTDEVGAKSFNFLPASGAPVLPIHVTSSLVTELAPFVFLLRHGYFTVLIFEEPEAHLHATAQRHLARTLIKLVNTGVRVIVTTHSDVFVQEINNLMSLHAHPKADDIRHKYGYDEGESLDPDAAKAYWLRLTPEGTVTEELRKTPDGFVNPDMNQALADLARMTLALQERGDA